MLSTRPLPITQEQIRLGGYASRDYAPALWQVPRDITAGSDWASVASHLMWMGSGCVLRADAKPGIDRDQALLHVGAVLHAVDMSVEHREMAAAYLLSEWFDTIRLKDNVSAGINLHREGQGNLDIGE